MNIYTSKVCRETLRVRQFLKLLTPFMMTMMMAGGQDVGKMADYVGCSLCSLRKDVNNMQRILPPPRDH